MSDTAWLRLGRMTIDLKYHRQLARDHRFRRTDRSCMMTHGTESAFRFR